MITLPFPQKLNTALRSRIAVAMFFFISGFTFSSWASRIPSLQQQLRLNDAQLGTVLFAMPMGLMLTMPFTGILLGRVSSRFIMMMGALLYAVLLPVLGLVTQVWQLVAILFLFGSSRNFLNIAINAQSVGVQALYKRSIITSFHGVFSVAGFCGAALGSFMLTANVSTFMHFMIVGGITLLIIACFFSHTLQEDVPADTKRPLLVLPDKPLLKLGLIAFCSMACEGAMYDWSGIYFQKEVQGAEAHIGLGYVAYMCAMATGRFAGDRLVNRFGAKKMLQVCGCFMAAGLTIAVVFPYFIVAMIGFLVTGFGVSCVVPLVFSLTGKNTRMAAGPAIAAVSIVSYFGFLLGPPFIGYISQTANLRWAFAVVALLGLLAVFMARKVAVKQES